MIPRAGPQQTTQQVLMIRPAAFGFNPQTAASNRFQQPSEIAAADAARLAVAEFDGAVRALRSEGIEVCVADDQPASALPDAVFPNNWVSFHADGTVVLYPMESPTRRRERRRDVIERVCAETDYEVTRWVDLTAHENAGRYLEGTGSLVLDRVRKVAFACRSSRTHEAVLREWCDALGYEAEVFDAHDVSGVPIYHTNVVMSIGRRFAVLCVAALAPQDRERVVARLTAAGRDIIAISQAELAGFCGNVLELGSWDESMGDCSVLALSATARASFASENFARLSALVDVMLPIPIPTIERLGGGSIRCMIAEVFGGAPTEAV